MDLISGSLHWSMYSLCSVKFPPAIPLTWCCTYIAYNLWLEWLSETLITVLKLYAVDGWGGNKAFYSTIAMHNYEPSFWPIIVQLYEPKLKTLLVWW